MSNPASYGEYWALWSSRYDIGISHWSSAIWQRCAESHRFNSCRVPCARRWCDQSVAFTAVLGQRFVWPMCFAFLCSLCWGSAVFGWNFRHRLARYYSWIRVCASFLCFFVSISSMLLISNAVIAQRVVAVWMIENGIFFVRKLCF